MLAQLVDLRRGQGCGTGRAQTPQARSLLELLEYRHGLDRAGVPHIGSQSTLPTLPNLSASHIGVGAAPGSMGAPMRSCLISMVWKTAPEVSPPTTTSRRTPRRARPTTANDFAGVSMKWRGSVGKEWKRATSAQTQRQTQTRCKTASRTAQMVRACPITPARCFPEAPRANPYRRVAVSNMASSSDCQAPSCSTAVCTITVFVGMSIITRCP